LEPEANSFSNRKRRQVGLGTQFSGRMKGKKQVFQTKGELRKGERRSFESTSIERTGGKE